MGGSISGLAAAAVGTLSAAESAAYAFDNLSSADRYVLSNLFSSCPEVKNENVPINNAEDIFDEVESETLAKIKYILNDKSNSTLKEIIQKKSKD